MRCTMQCKKKKELIKSVWIVVILNFIEVGVFDYLYFQSGRSAAQALGLPTQKNLLRGKTP